jgi:hypothetical protein
MESFGFGLFFSCLLCFGCFLFVSVILGDDDPNRLRSLPKPTIVGKRQHHHRNVETFTVVPFVMETTGFIHEKGIELLEKIADRRQEMKKHHKKDSLSYFLNLLSVCYPTQMVRARIKRVGEFSSAFRNFGLHNSG